ncbi:hypothetical protein [Microvirga roseola]|uniref:hypothetical protein n=1 Tax=Microvirga roseola TaxID=2883126 RepID=UPI001E5F3601|nr:hypothetical protein [Microvirga roseola]
MAERRITAFFDTYDEAATAVRRLETSNISGLELSLIASNVGEDYAPRATHASDEDTATGEMAGAGATAGTVIGGGAGLLAGLGTVAIPGFGPIVAAGWLVATLVGAGTGAAVGSLAGALAGAGLDEEEAHTYEEGIRRGGVLVIARVGEAEADRVIDILDDEGRINAGERSNALRSDDRAPPIGAAASTTTGLMTDLMPNPLDQENVTEVEVEDERLRRISGADRERG